MSMPANHSCHEIMSRTAAKERTTERLVKREPNHPALRETATRAPLERLLRSLWNMGRGDLF